MRCTYSIGTKENGILDALRELGKVDEQRKVSLATHDSQRRTRAQPECTDEDEKEISAATRSYGMTLIDMKSRRRQESEDRR